MLVSTSYHGAMGQARRGNGCSVVGKISECCWVLGGELCGLWWLLVMHAGNRPAWRPGTV